MDVKEAVRAANDYVAELFAEQGLKHIGLEEVVFDDRSGKWKVTIGFFREMDRLHGLAAAVGGQPAGWKRRTFKSVEIDDASGTVESVKHRRFNGDAPDAG